MATTSQNQVLNQNSSIFDSIFSVGERALSAFSSFREREAAVELARINAQYYQPIPTTDYYNQGLQTNQNAVSLLVYGGIGLALLGVGAIIWKQFK